MLWLYLSFVFYTINSLLWKWAVQSEHPISLINRRAVFTFSLVVLSIFLTGISWRFVTEPGFYLILWSSFFGTIGLILMVYFLKEGSFTRFSYYSFLGMTINGTATLLMGREQLTTSLVVSICILLAGYSLFVWDENRSLKKQPLLRSQHLLLGLMTIMFSTSTLLGWLAMDTFSPLQLMVVQELFVLVTTSLLSLLWLKKSIPFTTGLKPRYPLMALFIMLAMFTSLTSLQTLNPLVNAINGVIVPVLTLLGGVVVFREKMNKVQIVSLIIICIGEVFFIWGR